MTNELTPIYFILNEEATAKVGLKNKDINKNRFFELLLRKFKFRINKYVHLKKKLYQSY